MPAFHILLTGPPGVGKTTIIKKVCEELKKKNLKIDGFFTEEVRVGRERIGFDVVTLSGKRDVLARVSSDTNAKRLPKVGKYSVDVPSFENLALPVFECTDLDILVLDEVGKMELFSKAFLSKARKAFDSSSVRILATIPVPKSPLPLVDGLRQQENCSLIQVNKENRNELPAKIIQQLLQTYISRLLSNVNSTNEQLTSWLGEASAPEQSQYVRPQEGFAPGFEGLLAKYYPGSIRYDGTAPLHRNPNFMDIESPQKRFMYHHPLEGGRYDYRSSQYPDHHPMSSIVDYDVAAPLRKHDNYGGWDMFGNGGGGGSFGNGQGIAHVGTAVKKGKEAKALFILMAPLILLAVFGPILATQAMIPWVANGGLASISTIASNGKRKRRSVYDPRQTAELEKRLQLFLEVQDFIAKSGSADFAEEIGEAFLRCQTFTERRNKCLERVACEYADQASAMDSAERRIAKMVFHNIMSNTMVPAAIKSRLSKGSTFGKSHRGRCKNYWCEAVDGPLKQNHKH